jgi:hypothetical protein
MTIHVTPIPSTIALVAPSYTLGLANVAGNEVTAVASDSELLAFDTTVPTTIEPASAAAGSATVASRRDHVHGFVSEIPAYFSGASDGTLQSDSYNIEALTRDSTGAYTVTWLADFGNTNYAVVGNCEADSIYFTIWSPALGTCSFKCYDQNATLTNVNFHVIAAGVR